MPKYLRVVEKDDKWSVELDGEEQAVYDTQAEAEVRGRELAREKGAEFRAAHKPTDPGPR
ncbi:MAG: DUF2188 domain-containing protein [Actinobacteria bacterium]|nr:DUF2188 domain-containing protein [Actinomycetota bacterium]